LLQYRIDSCFIQDLSVRKRISELAPRAISRKDKFFVQDLLQYRVDGGFVQDLLVFATVVMNWVGAMASTVCQPGSLQVGGGVG
jgi:hypothetical protein